MQERSDIARLLGLARRCPRRLRRERGARGKSPRRSGDAAGRRLSPSGLRSAGLAALSRSLRSARLHRRRCGADLDAAVGDERRPVGRPPDAQERCRRRCLCSSTVSRGWAARSTSTRSTTVTTRPTPCATSSVTSTALSHDCARRRHARSFGKSSGGFGAMHSSWSIPGLCGVRLAQRRLVLSIRASAGVSRPCIARWKRTSFDIAGLRRGLRAQAQARAAGVYDDGDAGLRRRLFAAAAQGVRRSTCRSTRARASCATTCSRAGSLSIRPSAIATPREALERLRLALSRLRASRRIRPRHRRARRRAADSRARLQVRHEEFDDDHRNIGYRYEISLPALAAVLDNE